LPASEQPSGGQQPTIPLPPAAPQWNPAGARQKDSKIIPLVLVGCGCLGFVGFVLLGAVLLPVISQARAAAQQKTCITNLKQQSLALMMYAQDSDECFPPAKRWMDLADPYLRDEQPLHCPTVSAGNPSAFGYAYYVRASEVPLASIEFPQSTPLVFDSTSLGRNSSDTGGSFAVSPPRHPGPRGRGRGANLAFMDGSVGSFSSFPNPR
jgi:Protein of unknown function (DUF1559).